MIKKRIAVISYHTCPLSDEQENGNRWVGGLNIYVMQLSKELARMGYALDIFTRSQDENCPRIVEIEPNLRLIHLKAGGYQNIEKKEIKNFIPEFVNNLLDFIREENLAYDIVSAHYYLSGLAGLEIKKKFGIPLLITFHTLGLMKNLVARNEDEKEDIDRIKAEISLVQMADRIIATSEADAEYLKTLYNSPEEKIDILIPGVNTHIFKPMDKNKAKQMIQADPEYKIVLFVGRIEPVKAIDVLLYAIKILLEKYPDLKICVWIVGGDISKVTSEWSRELQKLEEIRRILDIATIVKFVGRKSQEELVYYYNAAEAVVMPSHYESFGLTALESMACGVPVITTDVMGVSELFDHKHAALITSANNPLMLAEKINKLLMDTNQHAKISKEVFEKVQDLDWHNVAEKFVVLCKTCTEVKMDY